MTPRGPHGSDRERRFREERKVVVMKELDVEKYRAFLLAKREEIEGKSRKREDIWIVQSNEQIETVQLAGEREFAVCVLEQQSKVRGRGLPPEPIPTGW